MEQNRTKWDIMGQFKGVWNVTKQVKLGQRGIKPGHDGKYWDVLGHIGTKWDKTGKGGTL